MDYFSYLAGLSDLEFEAERCRLIGQEINNAPPELRSKLLVAQMELDQLRNKTTPEQFMTMALRQATENMENISDSFVAIGHLTGIKPQKEIQ